MENKFKLLFAAIIIFNTVAVSAQAQKKPNFLFFLTDDWGYDVLGCYGNNSIKTPNIDDLAAKGLKFQNAILTTSSRSPSRCSIISGRYPHNTGAPELHSTLLAGQVMFPELLRKIGYYTALSGKNHMGNEVKAAFDTISTGKGPGGEGDWVSIMKNRPANKPFFFWFACHDGHRPWQFDKNGAKFDPATVKVPTMMFDGPETRKDIAGYYHEISRADYFMGELVKELKRENVLDNTYIIFMSDNGMPFPRCKTRLYDSGIKTPFIVSGPGIKPGVTYTMISAVDLSATVLDIVNVPKDHRIQGISFLSVLKNPKAKTRDFAFSEHNWHVYKADERSVRYGNWLYIRNLYPEIKNLSSESDDTFPAGKELWDAYARHLTKPWQEDVFMVPRPVDELYDLKADPDQFHNIAGDKANQKVLAFLSGKLDAWIKDTGDNKPTHPTEDRKGPNWKRGEMPGDATHAYDINNPGPIYQVKNK